MAILLAAAADAVILVYRSNSPQAPAPRGALRIRGADISFTLQEEAVGKKFFEGGRVLPVERILAANGANDVRLRVWLDPAGIQRRGLRASAGAAREEKRG
jgi:arabinogalactan endo-1,4-beta-galactosidase